MGSFDFRHIKVDRRDNGIVLFTLNRPERRNALNATLHAELASLPQKIAEDGATRVAIVTGAGEAFCIGGDFEMIEDSRDDFAAKMQGMREALRICYSMVDCPKPIISAINGPAAGGGLAVALLADISIINEDTIVRDGHTKIGMSAGDHSALIWPLLCSMAKAKLYLLTSRKIDGREAERIGLVSEAVPADDVLPRALQTAEEISQLSPIAIEFTKRSMNCWIRSAMPAFEASLAYQMVTTFAPDGLDYLSSKPKAAPEFQQIVKD
jgi:enoyl-CoA hydratase